MSKRILYLFFFLVLVSCSGENSGSTISEEISAIIPPFEGDFVNSAVFSIDPTIENVLETPNGSSCIIPANSLVDEHNQPVTASVEIKFDQYHSITDILSSGIPMEYDSLGEKHTFESAGMFSLEGTANDKPVFIKDGSAVDVNLASDKDQEEPFNFYSLDENTGDWTYEHGNTPVKGNPRFDPVNKVHEPKPVSEDAFVLDVNFDLSDHAELALFSGIVWEYTGKHDSLDPRLNADMAKTRWTDFNLEPTYEDAYEYYMTMKKGKKSFTTQVKAALDGENMELAMEAFKTKKVELAKQQEALQKPFIRSVKIAGFGTYNFDYIYKIEAPAQIIADFDFKEQNHLKDNALVFVVYQNEDVVVNYPRENWKLFGLNTKADPKILAVLPDNQIAICNQDVTQSFSHSSYTYEMDVLDGKIESKADIIDAIASIQ